MSGGGLELPTALASPAGTTNYTPCDVTCFFVLTFFFCARGIETQILHKPRRCSKDIHNLSLVWLSRNFFPFNAKQPASVLKKSSSMFKALLNHVLRVVSRVSYRIVCNPRHGAKPPNIHWQLIAPCTATLTGLLTATPAADLILEELRRVLECRSGRPPSALAPARSRLHTLLHSAPAGPAWPACSTDCPAHYRGKPAPAPSGIYPERYFAHRTVAPPP